jgi:outer membrane protein
VRESAGRFIGLMVVAVVLVPAIPASAQAPAPPAAEVLTVEQAVTLALRNNRSVGVAALEVERAEQRVGAARARRLPNLELQATAGTTLNPIRVSYPAGAFGSYPGIGPIPAGDTVVTAPRALSGNINATLSQPLTQLHRIGLNTKLNELGRDAERQKLRAERAAVVAEVRRLYYELLQAESAIHAEEELVRVYRELDRVVSEQVRAEVALRSDGLDVKSRLVAEESRLEGLRGDLATGKERMNDLLGRDLEHEFGVVAVAESSPEEGDLPAAVASALARRPDLAEARLAVEQADTDRRMKKAESIPEVSLAVTYYSFVNVDLLPRNIAIAGVQLKWEPFDWGRKGKERAEKQLQVQQAQGRAQQAESQARIEVAHRFRKLREARLSLEAQRLGRESAEEALRVVTARHGQEAALLKDVLQAQAKATSVQAQYDQALSTFWTAKADFQQAIGEEL